jgi:hypothetical protein
MIWDETIDIGPPAAPGNNATVTLFDSTTMFGGEPCNAINLFKINRVSVTFLSVNQASAASGLRSYASSDKGTNFDETQAALSIPATVAGVVNTYDYPVDGYDDFRLTYTAGATGPTTWRISIKAIVGQRQVAT